MSHIQKNEHEPMSVDEALEAGFSFEDHEWEDESDSTEEATHDPITQLTGKQEDVVKSMPRERLEEVLDDLDQHKFEVNPELYFKIRESVINALRPFVHEDLGIAEFKPKKDPNQPTLRYKTDAEVFELFPEPEPRPEPEKAPAEIIQLSKHRLPTPKIVQYNEGAKMYEFPGLS